MEYVNKVVGHPFWMVTKSYQNSQQSLHPVVTLLMVI